MTAVPAPEPPRRRVLLEDPRADHQIRISMSFQHEIAVSCTCRRAPFSGGRHGGRPYYDPIEARMLFPAAEAWDAWADWHLTGGGAS